MRIEYDHRHDILYIKLADHEHAVDKQITENFVLSLDEAGQVIGIEILDARHSGIDPLTLSIEHYTPEHPAAPITEAEVQAFNEGVERRQRKKQQQPTE